MYKCIVTTGKCETTNGDKGTNNYEMEPNLDPYPEITDILHQLV
jgi:hypothetical protein